MAKVIKDNTVAPLKKVRQSDCKKVFCIWKTSILKGTGSCLHGPFFSPCICTYTKQTKSCIIFLHCITYPT